MAYLHFENFSFHSLIKIEIQCHGERDETDSSLSSVLAAEPVRDEGERPSASHN